MVPAVPAAAPQLGATPAPSAAASAAAASPPAYALLRLLLVKKAQFATDSDSEAELETVGGAMPAAVPPAGPDEQEKNTIFGESSANLPPSAAAAEPTGEAEQAGEGEACAGEACAGEACAGEGEGEAGAGAAATRDSPWEGACAGHVHDTPWTRPVDAAHPWEDALSDAIRRFDEARLSSARSRLELG